MTKPVELGVQSGTQTVSQRKLRIARDRLINQPERLFTVFHRIAHPAPTKQVARAQKKFVGGKVVRRVNLHARSFARGKICTQRFGDSFSQFALQREKIRQLAIESISPNVRVGLRVDQLGVNPPPITSAAHGSLQNMRYAKRLGDLAQISRTLLVLPH